MTATTPSVEFSLPDHYHTNRSSPNRWVLSHAVRHWVGLMMLFVGALGNAGLAALIPMMIGQAFNGILASPPQMDVLLRAALVISASALGRGVLQLMRNFGAELIAQYIERDIRDELYTSLLGKSMTFHSLQSVGDTMARATNDVREVNLLFSPGVNLVIGSLSFLFMPVFTAPQIHPSLVITPLIFIVLYFITLWDYMRRLHPVTDAVRHSFGVLNGRLSEALDGIETVKGSAQEQTEVALFGKNARAYRNAAVREGEIEAQFLPLLLFGIATAAGLLHALLLMRQGVIDIGQVVAYFGLLMLLDFPTWTSMWAYAQIALGLAGARRILALLNNETRLDQNAAGYAAPLVGEIEFRDVCFQYEGSADSALEHVSFKIKPGQTIAIVGQTGVGKTSLIRMVNRTYDANCGQVLVDGVDVRDWNLEALRRSISIIEQDVFLFSRSICENIRFGKPDATMEQIEAAAKAAQADDFITSFKDGYDTVIGERGVTLSGGQRQRLALARAFLTNPAILILDDSTSAIDSATEDKIQRAIFAAARGRTTLIITHRLSQIRWADQIIVLRQGRIAAIGSHAELLRTSEAYRRIFSE